MQTDQSPLTARHAPCETTRLEILELLFATGLSPAGGVEGLVDRILARIDET